MTEYQDLDDIATGQMMSHQVYLEKKKWEEMVVQMGNLAVASGMDKKAAQNKPAPGSPEYVDKVMGDALNSMAEKILDGTTIKMTAQKTQDGHIRLIDRSVEYQAAPPMLMNPSNDKWIYHEPYIHKGDPPHRRPVVRESVEIQMLHEEMNRLRIMLDNERLQAESALRRADLKNKKLHQKMQAVITQLTKKIGELEAELRKYKGDGKGGDPRSILID